LFPKIEDWNAFKLRVELICRLILEDIAACRVDEHLFSVDEKTGIQALEREKIYSNSSGKVRRIEYEYKRHGTTTLIGALNIRNGQMEYYRIHPTRKEEDFAKFVHQILQNIPNSERIIFLLDQLNIHKSETLVRLVAKHIGFQGDLGIKQFNGILKNQKSRMKFLEDPQHRIRIVFTPKHCSWLNPIENWFGKLQRHRIHKASFTSIEDLENKIKEYINFANKWLAKPYKWKFKGFVKQKLL
jgi:transposase